MCVKKLQQTWLYIGLAVCEGVLAKESVLWMKDVKMKGESEAALHTSTDKIAAAVGSQPIDSKEYGVTDVLAAAAGSWGRRCDLGRKWKCAWC